jgi:hypothetical protein
MSSYDVENIITKICNSKYIVSSSLHGIILAHAYGKKALWVNMFGNNKLHGDSIKFFDYYASINIYDIKAFQIETFIKLTIQEQEIIIENYPNPTRDIIKILQSNIINNTDFIDKTKINIDFYM